MLVVVVVPRPANRVGLVGWWPRLSVGQSLFQRQRPPQILQSPGPLVDKFLLLWFNYFIKMLSKTKIISSFPIRCIWLVVIIL